MKKIKLILLILILISLGLLFIPKNSRTPQPATTENQQVLQSTIKVTQKIIVYSENNITETENELAENSSVLDALLSAQNLEVETKEYSFGALVESINGAKNGENNKYWIFSVNGQEATVGAGAYILKDGDVITWEFKEYEQ